MALFPYGNRWNQFPSMHSMMHHFDDLFDSFVDNQAALRLRDNAGQLKFSDDGRSFDYRINASGYRPEELKVDLEENSVVIEGEHREERAGESVHRKFTRRFTIPEGIDHNTIKCHIDERGLLSVHGSKKAIDATKKRTIPIGSKPAKQGRIEEPKK